MYIKEILWFLTWPALIAISWFVIRLALKKFESHLPKDDEEPTS